MNEPMERLEAELSAMRPRRVSPHLAGALSAALTGPSRRSLSDRVLVFAMAVGALAACVIVVLLTFETTYVPPTPEKTTMVRTVEQPDHAYAYTRASSGWRDRVN